MIPAVINRAIELNLRTPEQGLQLAINSDNPADNVALLVLLLESDKLNKQQRAQAQSLALEKLTPLLEDRNSRMNVSSLVTRLFLICDAAHHERAFALLLSAGLGFRAPIEAIANAFTDEDWSKFTAHIKKLAAKSKSWNAPTGLTNRFAPYFPKKYIPDLVTIIENMDVLDFKRQASIEAFAPYVDEPEALRLLALARNLEQDRPYTNPQAQAYAALVPVLDEKRATEIIAYARDYDGQHAYVTPLILSVAVRHDLVYLDEAIVAMCLLERHWQVDAILKNLLPYLQWSERLPAIVTFVERAENQYYYTLLEILLPLLDANERNRLVQVGIDRLPTVRAGDPDSIDEEYQVGALRRIAPFITEKTFKTALDFILKVKSKREACYMLIDLLPVTPQQRRHEILRHALDAADGQTYAPHISGSNGGLQRLVPHLEGDLLQEVFDMAVKGVLPPYQQEMAEMFNKHNLGGMFLRGANSILANMAPVMTADMVKTVLERDGV